MQPNKPLLLEGKSISTFPLNDDSTTHLQHVEAITILRTTHVSVEQASVSLYKSLNKEGIEGPSPLGGFTNTLPSNLLGLGIEIIQSSYPLLNASCYLTLLVPSINLSIEVSVSRLSPTLLTFTFVACDKLKLHSQWRRAN